MKHTLLATLTWLFLLFPLSFGQAAEPASATPPPAAREESPGAGAAVQGVKELLTVAADRAVKGLAKPDGYFANKSIRIDMPDELEHLPPYLHDRGYQAQVNVFIQSLNRTAEKAAPKAAVMLADLIRETAFDDAGEIVNKGATAATDYFRKKNSEKLYKTFTPVIVASMKEAGVSRAYREMMEKYDYESVASFPVDNWSFDLEGYVTGKALDGLYRMMGEEEKKIRYDPAAQSTELLRQVFGKPE